MAGETRKRFTAPLEARNVNKSIWHYSHCPICNRDLGRTQDFGARKNCPCGAYVYQEYHIFKKSYTYCEALVDRNGQPYKHLVL